MSDCPSMRKCMCANHMDIMRSRIIVKCIISISPAMRRVSIIRQRCRAEVIPLCYPIILIALIRRPSKCNISLIRPFARQEFDTNKIAAFRVYLDCNFSFCRHMHINKRIRIYQIMEIL